MNEKAKNIITNYRKDIHYRALLMLYINFSINVGYAVFEAICGYVLHSAWMGTMAFYYIVLSSMRFYILKRHKKSDVTIRWKTYRNCGIVMLLLTIAIAGIHILTMSEYHAIEYKGYMIYAVATYTFYVAVSAIRNVVIYRKVNDPILSASKAINIVVASISMYNLQAAMITAFGKGDENFRVTMGNCVGVGVLVIIVGIAIYMIMRAIKNTRKLIQ